MSEQPYGLLWYDNSKKDWREKVLDAAAAYKDKFWIPATIVKVNIRTIEPNIKMVDLNPQVELVGIVGEVEVYTSPGTAVNHFFAYNHRVLNPRKPEGAGAQRSRGAEEQAEAVQARLFDI